MTLFEQQKRVRALKALLAIAMPPTPLLLHCVCVCVYVCEHERRRSEQSWACERGAEQKSAPLWESQVCASFAPAAAAAAAAGSRRPASNGCGTRDASLAFGACKSARKALQRHEASEQDWRFVQRSAGEGAQRRLALPFLVACASHNKRASAAAALAADTRNSRLYGAHHKKKASKLNKCAATDRAEQRAAHRADFFLFYYFFFLKSAERAHAGQLSTHAGKGACKGSRLLGAARSQAAACSRSQLPAFGRQLQLAARRSLPAVQSCTGAPPPTQWRWWIAKCLPADPMNSLRITRWLFPMSPPSTPPVQLCPPSRCQSKRPAGCRSAKLVRRQTAAGRKCNASPTTSGGQFVNYTRKGKPTSTSAELRKLSSSFWLMDWREINLRA